VKIAHEVGVNYLLPVIVLNYFNSSQINVFLNHLNSESIGISVFGIFVIDKNTILTVRLLPRDAL